MKRLPLLLLPALLLAFATVTVTAQNAPDIRPTDRVQPRPEPAKPQPVERDTKEEAEKPEADKEDIKVAKIGEAAPDFTLKDANGKEHKLSDYKGKIIVLEWINLDCPWCKAHYDGKEELLKMQNDMRENDVVWLYICSSAKGRQGHFEGEALTERLKKESIDAGYYLIDADGKVARMYEARVTPHAYVICTEGKLRYNGALDNLPDQRRGSAEPVNYVEQVVNALQKGEKIETPERRPYG